MLPRQSLLERNWKDKRDVRWKDKKEQPRRRKNIHTRSLAVSRCSHCKGYDLQQTTYCLNTFLSRKGYAGITTITLCPFRGATNNGQISSVRTREPMCDLLFCCQFPLRVYGARSSTSYLISYGKDVLGQAIRLLFLPHASTRRTKY